MPFGVSLQESSHSVSGKCCWFVEALSRKRPAVRSSETHFATCISRECFNLFFGPECKGQSRNSVNSCSGLSDRDAGQTAEMTGVFWHLLQCVSFRIIPGLVTISVQHSVIAPHRNVCSCRNVRIKRTKRTKSGGLAGPAIGGPVVRIICAICAIRGI